MGSLGYFIYAVIGNNGKDKFAPVHLLQLNRYGNGQTRWRVLWAFAEIPALQGKEKGRFCRPEPCIEIDTLARVLKNLYILQIARRSEGLPWDSA